MNKTQAIVKQAALESTELALKIDKLVNAYLKKSKMSKNQKIVNVGRALNAYHVNWISNMALALEVKNEEILDKEYK